MAGLSQNQMPEELVGQFKKELYRNDDHWTVCLLTSGAKVTGIAEPGELVPGLSYRFVGKWVTHQQHGRQFQHDGFVKHVPPSADGVVRYLVHHCKGIGPATARRIVSQWAPPERALDELRHAPEKVAQVIPGLYKSTAIAAAATLRQQWQTERTQIELLQIFEGRGFARDLWKSCYRKWGVSAPDKIKRDPYLLLEEKFPSVGFGRCDQLYLDLGHPADSIRRQVVLVWHCLKSDRSGSTWTHIEDLRSMLRERISHGVQPDKAIETAVNECWIEMREDHIGLHHYLALAPEAYAEDAIARIVTDMVA